MFPYIVADIGGTNARFALVTAKHGEQFAIGHVQILQGAEFETFEDAMAHYIESIGDQKPTAACAAIAGPIQNDKVAMTNLSWSFSQKAVRDKFGLDAFVAINDYTALAVATSRLPSHGLDSVLPGLRSPKGNKAILGPGTGLGVAGLAHANGAWLPIPSEGGHVNMAPADEFECDVLKAAIKRHGHVSAEVFISGPGLVNLCTAIADVEGVQVDALEPQDITARGLDDSDALCAKTLNLFCGFLGTVSGNLALTYGAFGGVYITGGIVPRFPDFFKQSLFVQRFREKGVMSHYVSEIPVDIVTYEQTAFLGAAAWLDQTLNRGQIVV